MSEAGDIADPAPEAVSRLVDYYRRAAERMRSLPVYNAALAVEAVGFREHDGRQVGVIVTPWFMNLTALPTAQDRADWQKGTSARLALPSGRYDFVVSEAGDIGVIATCSLFPLMHDFADQDTARDAAAAAMAALMQPEPPAQPPAPKAAPQLSRRRFLGG